MRSSITLAFLFVSGASLAACTATEPTAVPLLDGGRGDLGPGAGDNADLLPPDDGKVDPPVLDAPIQLTSYLTVPVNGMAEKGSSVLIENTAAGTISVDVAADGRFCANVKLNANAVNTLSLRAVDGNGNLSEAINLSIKQQGAPPAPAASPVSENASIGGSGSSAKLVFQRNDESAMIDSDRSTSFGGRHTPFTDYALATVRLAQRSRIQKFVVRSPADCPFTAAFDVYYSNADAPSSPKVDPMAWTKISPQERDEAHASVSFQTPVIATHVSVVWPYDGWSSDGLNCGSWVLGPYYAISEVEAWTAPNVAPPPPTAPSCTGGG